MAVIFVKFVRRPLIHTTSVSRFVVVLVAFIGSTWSPRSGT